MKWPTLYKVIFSVYLNVIFVRINYSFTIYFMENNISIKQQ